MSRGFIPKPAACPHGDGIGRSFGEAYAKAAEGAGLKLPESGTAFVSVNDNDKEEVVPITRDLVALGFRIVGTGGTAAYLQRLGIEAEMVFKVNEGHPNIADRIAAGEIQLVINTPLGKESHYDETAIRKASLAYGIPCITTLSGSRAVVDAIETLRAGDWDVESLQAGWSADLESPRNQRSITEQAQPDQPS